MVSPCISTLARPRRYSPTREPMILLVLTRSNNSARSDFIRAAYLEAYEGTPDYMRMPLITPNVVDGKVIGNWPGLGGASSIGLSDIPTIGLEVQPDYLCQ